MKELYTRIEELKEEADIKVQVTYIEIYNEEIKDLIHAVEGRPARPLKVSLISNSSLILVWRGSEVYKNRFVSSDLGRRKRRSDGGRRFLSHAQDG